MSIAITMLGANYAFYGFINIQLGIELINLYLVSITKVQINLSLYIILIYVSMTTLRAVLERL